MLSRIVTAAALGFGAVYLTKRFNQRSSRNLSSVQESIEVNVPASTAYNQWTQFEDFPKFMESVREIKQLDDRRLQWRAEIDGKEKEWDVKITEQIPDKRIAWCSTSGARNAGVVTFHRLSDHATRIMLQMSYEPEGAVEHIGDALGAVRMEARKNLQDFKTFIEARGSETGTWRGSVAQH